MSKCRVVYFEVRANGTGSIMSLRAMLGLLDRSRYEPIIWFGSAADASKWKDETIFCMKTTRFANVDFFPAAFRFYWIRHCIGALLRGLLDIFRVPRMLRRLKPDILHLNQESGLTVGLIAKWMGIPVVWHVRGLVCENWIGRLQDRLYAYAADRVIAISAVVASRLPQAVAQGKLVRIYDSIGTLRIPSKERCVEFRARYGVPSDSLVVLLLGSVNEQKGYGFLADVAAALSPDTRIFFLLAGSMSKTSVQLAEKWRLLIEANRAVFTGHVDSATAITNADIVVCPNLVPEALGRTVLEAYTLGKTVITMDQPSFRETVVDGETGWLLPPDTAIWASKLEELARNRTLLTDLKPAIDKQLARFDDKIYREQLHALYAAVLAERNEHVS